MKFFNESLKSILSIILNKSFLDFLYLLKFFYLTFKLLGLIRVKIS